MAETKLSQIMELKEKSLGELKACPLDHFQLTYFTN